jgi:hypothetical protein
MSSQSSLKKVKAASEGTTCGVCPASHVLLHRWLLEDHVCQHYEMQTDDGSVFLMPAFLRLYNDMVAAVTL